MATSGATVAKETIAKADAVLMPESIRIKIGTPEGPDRLTRIVYEERFRGDVRQAAYLSASAMAQMGMTVRVTYAFGTTRVLMETRWPRIRALGGVLAEVAATMGAEGGFDHAQRTLDIVRAAAEGKLVTKADG